MHRFSRLALASLLVLGFLMACGGQPTPPPATPSPSVAPPTATAIPATATNIPPTATDVPPTATATVLPSATATLSQPQAIQTILASTHTAADATKAAQPTVDQTAALKQAQQVATAGAQKTADALTACLGKSADAPQDWQTLLCDTFDGASNGWSTRSVNTDLIAGGFAISKGRYEIEMTAKKGVVQRTNPRALPAEDFYLGIDAQRTGGSPGAQYGMFFRAKGDNYYLWSIADNGAFSVRSYIDKTWTTLLEGNAAQALHQGQANRLVVQGQGPRIGFYVNDVFVGSIQDARLKTGTAGLAVNMQPGEKIVVDLDNFVFLGPKPTSKPRPTIPPPAPSVARPTQPPAPQATQAPQNAGCPVDAGNAGILVINDFDGLMTFTVLNHEYKLDGHTQQWVQIPGGQEFTASVSVVGVGKTSFGPFSLQPGQCVKYEPQKG